jgi:hypothetical protein
METVFRQLKVACGADVLRSKKPVGIRNEIAARITAVNLVRMIMIDAARKCGREPTRLSFSAVLRAIAATSLQMDDARFAVALRTDAAGHRRRSRARSTRQRRTACGMQGREALPAPAWVTGELEGEPCSLGWRHSGMSPEPRNRSKQSSS